MNCTVDSMNDVNTFYQPLDRERREIRLLLVKAGSHLDDIDCEFRQSFLASSAAKVSYETISYCWGDPNIKCAIFVNGDKILIPASARNVLQRMRLPDANRLLWIDAVCINQEDFDERSHQVGMMDFIYSNSVKNLIWLGEEDGTAPQAIGMINIILDNAREETNQYETWRQVRDGFGQITLSQSGIQLPDDCTPLLRLYASPWFERVWVVQEAALSSINICHYGSSEIPLDDVLRAAVWLHHKLEYLPFTMRNQPNIWNAMTLSELCNRRHGRYSVRSGTATSLWILLSYLRYFKATDRKDHVYGVLGLSQHLSSSSSLARQLSVDYRKPLRSVFEDATRSIICQYHTVEVFRHIEERPLDSPLDESWPMWPSWVPHWHRAKEDRTTPHGLMYFYSANNGIELDIENVSFDTDPNILLLSGFVMDTATSISPVATFDTLRDGKATLSLMNEIFGLLEKASMPIDPESLAATLMAGSTQAGRRAGPQDGIDYSIWLKYLKTNKALPPDKMQINRHDLELSSEELHTSLYHSEVYVNLRNRRFFTTTLGSIGIGPQTMESTDTVVILYGCRWPIVLRPVEEGYRALGLCYVHGVMDGEAMRKHRAEGSADERFLVR